VVSSIRAQRIAARIQEELSEIILRESGDPRLAGVSVTDVKLDRELEYASVYVSVLEGSERQQEVLDGLKHAQGFLRSELARRIDLRSFPRLRFYWDPTFERADKMEQLFASIKSDESSETEVDNPSHPTDDDQPDDLEARLDE
jgi:ribosome-binding factor A